MDNSKYTNVSMNFMKKTKQSLTKRKKRLISAKNKPDKIDIL